MRSRYDFRQLCLCCVYFVTLSELVFAQPAPQTRSLSDSEFYTPDVVGTFRLGGNTFSIKKSVQNDVVEPSLWQFAYTPLFLPVRHDGKVEVSVNDKVVSFQIALSSKDANDLAFVAIQRAFPKESSQLIATNVRSLPVKSVKFQIPNLLRLIDPAAVLDPEEIPIFSAPDTIPVTLVASSAELAQRLARSVPNSYWPVSVSSSARIATQTNAKFEAGQQLSSLFQATLNGLPTDGPRYVFRNDLRKFLQTQKEFIKAYTVSTRDPKESIADTSSFITGFMDQVMQSWLSTAKSDYMTFSAGAKDSTFNKDDLATDKITSLINKIFTYDQEHMSYVLNTGADTGGGFGFLDILKVDGHFKGNYDKTEVQDWLRKNDIDTEIQGNLFVPKKLFVRQVNDGSLQAFLTAYVGTVYVSPAVGAVDTGMIDLSTRPPGTVESITGRVDTLESLASRHESRLSDLEAKLGSLANDVMGLKHQRVAVTHVERRIYGIIGDPGNALAAEVWHDLDRASFGIPGNATILAGWIVYDGVAASLSDGRGNYGVPRIDIDPQPDKLRVRPRNAGNGYNQVIFIHCLYQVP